MNTSAKPQKLTQAERVALSDEKMLKAATELILEIGTEKTTLKEVGERAGYSRGLASARFGSKDELFKRIMVDHRALWSSVLMHYTEGKTGLEAILSRVEAVKHVLKHEPDNIKVMYTLWFDSLGHPSGLRSALEDYNAASRRALSGILRQGIAAGEFPGYLDVDQFVIDYFSRIYGLIYQWLVSPNAVNTDKSMESLQTFCRNCLAINEHGL